MPPSSKGDLFPGTLDMLILATLQRAPLHGYAIAKSIQQGSHQMLRVEEGSLYPALQRMLIEGWISAKWGLSEHNRRIRIYALTAAGRKQLARETRRVSRVMQGVASILKTAES